MRLSARNQLAATVQGVNRGDMIANVVLDCNGQRLVASITKEEPPTNWGRRGPAGDRDRQGL